LEWLLERGINFVAKIIMDLHKTVLTVTIKAINQKSLNKNSEMVI
jgi:hypothetical protein